MREKHPSLMWRAFLALVLMVGFYVLAVAVAGVLLYLPYAELRYAQRVFNIKLTLGCIVGACAILWSILPRVDRFRAPGPRLEPSGQPRLFKELDAVAGAVSQAMPAEVYLVPDVNAWVSSRGGVMGFGSRRVMGLGLPLLQILTVTQLRAVLAHEFGHYHGGDTALAPWVYKTRIAIVRTLGRLRSNLIQKPFIWYAKLFLRITNAVGRRQEYSADALAAEVVGAQPLIAGLKTVQRAACAFDTYWRSEVAPVLAAGFHPPIGEGFATFMGVEAISRATAEALAMEMELSEENPYDTHPRLKDRIAALSNTSAKDVPADDPPAITLVDNVSAMEREMLRVLRGMDNAPELADISWKETLQAVYLPLWTNYAREHRKALRGITLGALPDWIERREELIDRFDEHLSTAVTGEEKWQAVSQIVGSAVAVVLRGRGHPISFDVGEPVQVRVGEECVKPFSLLPDLASGTMDGDRWKHFCSRTGMNDLDLGTEIENRSSEGTKASKG